MNEAKTIDGKAFAANLRARVTAQTAKLKAYHGITPGLAAVLVGEDPASQFISAIRTNRPSRPA
tara:strand:+ start:185 stop:376 length:192 start_codon:yes stop_codon:yes gene_type:complete